MNVIISLIEKFFYEEQFNVVLMFILSLSISIIQTNGISYITATIISSLNNNNKALSIVYFKYFIIASIIFICLQYFFKQYQHKILSKMRQWMRQQLVNAVLMKNKEDLSQTNFTKLNSPINRVSSVCFMLFNDLITYVLPNITFLLIIALYFLYKNPFLGSGFIIGNIILVLYLMYNWNDMVYQNEDYEKNVSETESYLQEILNNFDKIIYRGQTNSEIDNLTDKTNKSIDRAFLFYSNTNYHGTIMNIIVYIIIFASIGYLIFLFFDKKLDITMFITLFTIILLYKDHMNTLIQVIPDFIEFIGRSKTVLNHFKDMDLNIDTIKPVKYDKVNLEFKRIRFDNVTFKYKLNDKLVLDNFNINLDTNNKIIGVTGLSGNGKSTFVKLLLKLYKCNDGSIFIDEKNIDDIDSDYIRTNVTYINQSSNLFDKKVIDNMLYACNDMDVCKTSLNMIMKYDKIKELYRKIDINNTQSGSLGENLSGGQRQVVNIISGLINPSKILILDEPTNALDIGLKDEIISIIDNFRKYKQCIIIISHDRDVYPLFDEVIQL